MRRLIKRLLPPLAIFCTAAIHTSLAAELSPQSSAYFRGKIGTTAKDSIPDWPSTVTAPKGAPNVVVILLDDVGFGASSTFGGPVQMPELDRLAAQGLRYNRFHVTALCSPTRAALLSGRNDHRAGFGQIMEATSGFPGYNGIWRKDTVTVADVLRRNGYSTAAFGKWHNTPYSEISPVGPFDRWPTGLGFEYFFGFIRASDSHWEPSALYRNTTPVEASSRPEQGYYLTTDITNDAIAWVRTHESLAPEKPYFLYFAPGATHSPHHVAKAWIEKYRGQFDQGWDKLREEIFARQKALGVIPQNTQLTPRPEELPAWRSLSKDRRTLSAREMEVYAGFLAQTDYEVGRLVEAVRQGQRGDNTLILYIVGDNGADGFSTALEDRTDDAEFRTQLAHMDELGSKLHYNNYLYGWAWATNTPFQWTKGVASHLGGTRAPLVVSWPAQITHRGGLRGQYTHVNDVAATIYEATGVPFPTVVDGVKQLPQDGTSFVYSFGDPNAPSRHRLQIFEQAGNRSIYQDGWVAGAQHMVPWKGPYKDDFDSDRWELYHLDEDFSQALDLAAKHPNKLKELQGLFHSEARKNNVYPLLNLKFTQASSRSSTKEYIYYPGTPRIPGRVAPNLAESSFLITADVHMPEQGAEGVILSFGGRNGGFALYIKDNHLIYENNALAGSHRDTLVSTTPLSTGNLSITCEFIRRDSTASTEMWGRSSGIVRLYINGQEVGEATLAKVAPDIYRGTLGVGQAFGSPVSDSFVLPFKFSGTLEKVTVELR